MAYFAVACLLSGALAAAIHGVVQGTIRYRHGTILMRLAELPRELVYPLSHFAIVLPMIVSWLLFSLALFFGIFGLLVFLTTLVPFMGYLMKLLEARAHNAVVPAFDAELMSFSNSALGMFPLVPVVSLGWLYYTLAPGSPQVLAIVPVIAASAVLPALLGILSVTRSPVQSLNPVALFRFIRKTGKDYLLVIALLGVTGVAIVWLFEAGSPSFLLRLALIYLVFLLYTLTGGITARHDLPEEVDIPEPVALTPAQSHEELLRERQQALTHAYDFVSRGNRAGGLAHIQAHIDNEGDPDEAYNWFFNTLLKWENTDGALFFGQIYLHRLLRQQHDHQVLKVL